MQKGISFYPLFASRICCVLSRANPLSEKKSIAIEDLMEENIIVCTSGALPSVVAGIQSRTSGMFAYSKHHYCDEISVALSLVRAGYGFCILPDSRPAPVPDLAYVPLEGYDPLPCGIFVKESRKQEELIRSFTALFPVSAKL